MKKILAILAAIAMVGVATSAMAAADWSFYGSARVQTNYTTMSKDTANSGGGGSWSTKYDDSDTTWAVQGNSRIGANVAAGDVSGRFEYGTGVNLRLLYGVWNFGGGKLLAGQDYSPTFMGLSGQALGGGDGNMLGVGEFYDGRQGQLKLIMGNFDLALLTPVTTNNGGGTYNGNKDTILPKISASYKFSSDMFWVKLFGGYNSYNVTNANDDSKALNSYVLGLGGAVTFGPATIKGTVNYAVNPFDYGQTAAVCGWAAKGPFEGPGFGTATWNGSNFDDGKEYMGLLLVNYKASDMVSVEVGGSYKMQELEVKIPGATTKFERNVMVFYFQVPLTMAPGVYIIPEFSYYSLGDLKVTGLPDTKLGNITQFGAKWQINF